MASFLATSPPARASRESFAATPVRCPDRVLPWSCRAWPLGVARRAIGARRRALTFPSRRHIQRRHVLHAAGPGRAATWRRDGALAGAALIPGAAVAWGGMTASRCRWLATALAAAGGLGTALPGTAPGRPGSRSRPWLTCPPALVPPRVAASGGQPPSISLRSPSCSPRAWPGSCSTQVCVIGGEVMQRT